MTMHCSSPGSSVHGIFQARILEWVPISYSRIFPTQRLNLSLLHLLHWQVDSLPTVPPGKSHGQRGKEDYSLWGCNRVGHDLTKQQQHIYVCVCECIHTHIYTHICVYKYTHTYICIHTHIVGLYLRAY